MLAIGRLKALTEAHTPGSGGWAMAEYHEVSETGGTGIITARDRSNAMSDHRAASRSFPEPRGGAAS